MPIFIALAYLLLINKAMDSSFFDKPCIINMKYTRGYIYRIYSTVSIMR